MYGDDRGHLRWPPIAQEHPPSITADSIANLPKQLPPTLQPYAWRLSFEDSQNLRCSFKRCDVHGTGVLERSIVLKCLAEVIQEADRRNSPWAHFLYSNAPRATYFRYNDILTLIYKAKYGDAENGPRIDEILSVQSAAFDLDSHNTLAHTMPSDKWFKSRTLAKLTIDLENHLRKLPVNPVFEHLKVTRIRTSVTVDEFLDLLSTDRTTSRILSPFKNRLIDAFRNSHGKINYGEFVQFLDRLQPSLLDGPSKANTYKPLLLASQEAPLKPILRVEMEHPEAVSWTNDEWESYYREKDEESELDRG